MEKYEITKEQILELHESNSPETRIQIAKMFPDAFKKELEVGRWYKREDKYCNWLMNYQGEIMSCYGFNTSKKYSEHYTMNDDGGKWIEATPEELEEALIAEAKKRGYKKGVKVTPLYSDGSAYDNSNVKILEDKLSFDEHQNSLDFNNSSYRLFCKGKWATIIPEETKVITIEKAIKILSKKYGQKVEIK